MTEEEIAELKQTNEQLVSRVQQLESINSDLVSQKKELKQKLEEGASDEEVKKELENYKRRMEKMEAEKRSIQAEMQSIEEGYTTELNKMRLINELRASGVEAKNELALNTIADQILSEAKYEEGAFKFLNEEGTTRFNDANKPYSIIDKVNDLKETEFGIFFKEATGGDAAETPVTAQPKTDINSIIDAGLKY